MKHTLPWLEPGEPFPDVAQAWGAGAPAPGLLAAGGALDVPTLRQAYTHGIFPWFSAGQPILWWSPDPRMVLQTAQFRLHRSLRKTLQGLLLQGRLEVRMDTAFTSVIGACAEAPRRGQDGTWILPEMVAAFCRQHGIPQVDCQQNTGHLATLGAAEMPRQAFLEVVQAQQTAPAPRWTFEPLYWKQVLASPAHPDPSA